MHVENDEAEEVNTLAEAMDRIAALERRNQVLFRKLTQRVESLPALLPRFFRSDEVSLPSSVNEKPVDVVLTVKNTYDFLEPCLASILANTDVPYRLFLNDNASSDPRTPNLLRKTRDENPDGVELFLQEKDLGIPDAANLLFSKTSHDVIFINADTVVPPGWASRLLWPLRHSGEKVGSSAPFTNATAMGVFPCARIDNELLPGMDTVVTDRVFQLVKPTTEWRFPYSPGFCMALSRSALDEVGLFDANTFRPAYGEESDWCYRAEKLGYKHILAANLFVYHKHGVTFKRESSAVRDKLLADHIAILNRRYPGFEDHIHDFNDNPEYLALCSFLLFLAGCASGGGLSVRFIPYDALPKANSDPDEPTLLTARDAETGEYFLRFLYREYRSSFTSPNLNWAIKAMYRVKVNAILVEELPPGDEARTRRALARMGKYYGVTPRGKDGNEIHEA